MGWFVAAMLPFLLAMPAEAAKIGLNPLMGDGAPGTNTVISGFNFEVSASYTVTFGGLGVTPASVTSDASGNIAATTLVFPALPAGFHHVVLTSATRTYTFIGAYRVYRNICVSPVLGEGRAGQTSDTNAAIPTGGWVGMVFRIAGTGFAASASIAANSITVGGATTTHAAITVGAAGTFGSTTIIVDSNLAFGRKDIVLNDGVATTFAGVYEVRRSIRLNPSLGAQDAGTNVTISGWGFVDGMITANSTLVGGDTTTHLATTITNGAFVYTLSLDAEAGAKNDVEILGQGIFANAYAGAKAGKAQLAVSSIVFAGVPNQAFRPYEKIIEYAILVPNPANEVVWISYRLAATFGDVKVRIYAVSGEHIYTGSAPGTMTSFKWDLRNSRGTRVAQGLYVVVLEAGDSWTGKRDRTILKLAVR